MSNATVRAFVAPAVTSLSPRPSDASNSCDHIQRARIWPTLLTCRRFIGLDPRTWSVVSRIAPRDVSIPAADARVSFVAPHFSASDARLRYVIVNLQ
jgi:hypothetical protein